MRLGATYYRVKKMLDGDSEPVLGVAHAVALQRSAIISNPISTSIQPTIDKSSEQLTLMQMSRVLDTQSSGTLPKNHVMPLTSRVLVPPLLSTLHSSPDRCSGLPTMTTPLTASKAAPVMSSMA